jgi:hypothetical protein
VPFTLIFIDDNFHFSSNSMELNQTAAP